MKSGSWKVYAFAALVSLMVGCAPAVTVHTDYRPGTDYSIYKTFTLSQDGIRANPFVEERIRQAIATQLEAKGLNQVEASGDIVVVPRARLRAEQQLDVSNTGGVGYRGAWVGAGSTRVDVREVPVGTLIVDLVDRASDELIWRGVAESMVDKSVSPEQSEKNINTAVAELFKGFPPGN